MSRSQAGSFVDSVVALNSEYIGNCAGACWLRQVRCTLAMHNNLARFARWTFRGLHLATCTLLLFSAVQCLQAQACNTTGTSLERCNEQDLCEWEVASQSCRRMLGDPPPQHDAFTNALRALEVGSARPLVVSAQLNAACDHLARIRP